MFIWLLSFLTASAEQLVLSDPQQDWSAYEELLGLVLGEERHQDFVEYLDMCGTSVPTTNSSFAEQVCSPLVSEQEFTMKLLEYFHVTAAACVFIAPALLEAFELGMVDYADYLADSSTELYIEEPTSLHDIARSFNSTLEGLCNVISS